MARLGASLLRRWSARLFSVEQEGALSYFALGEKHPGGQAPGVFGGIHKSDRCYSLHVSGGDKVHSAKLYADLRVRLQAQLPCCQLWPMLSFLPHVSDSLIRGYFLTPRCPDPAESLLGDLTQNEAVLVCSYVRDADSGWWTQRVWSGAGSPDETAQQLYLVPAQAPHHPAAHSIVNCDVFYSFQEAREVLQKCGDIIPESAAVLELLCNKPEARSKPDFPVIVIEGLDATGKTTLTESLTEGLGAALLRSPPQCLSPWRARFDREPPIVRRAFYALGNYLTAEEIVQRASHMPVIVDRFWHSTAAYAIATAVSGPICNLPAEGSEVYCWPMDLLQPSLVVLLTLDPEERKRRLKDRGQGKTAEEEQLGLNQLFRLRVEEAYQRISGPVCISVDASPPADQVLQQVLHLIRGKCHL